MQDGVNCRIPRCRRTCRGAPRPGRVDAVMNPLDLESRGRSSPSERCRGSFPSAHRRRYFRGCKGLAVFVLRIECRDPCWISPVRRTLGRLMALSSASRAIRHAASRVDPAHDLAGCMSISVAGTQAFTGRGSGQVREPHQVRCPGRRFLRSLSARAGRHRLSVVRAAR